MKKILLSAAAIAATALTAQGALADPSWDRKAWPKWYVGLNSGVAWHHESDVSGGTDVSYDTGYTFSGALGYNMDPIRVEGELFYTSHDVDEISAGGVTVNGNGDLSTSAIMLNMFYDFENASNLTPFIGGGIGIARVELDTGASDDDNVFAYQLRAGMGYEHELIPYVDFQLGYRFFGTADAKISGADVDNYQHSVELGARLNF